MHLPLTLLHDMGGLPGLELQAVMSVLAQFFLATIRIGAFLAAVPVFGAANVPLQVRIILSALLGVVVMGYVPVPTVDSYSELQILGVIVTELLEETRLEFCGFSVCQDLTKAGVNQKT